MFSHCLIEILKTKRTIIRKLVWIFPLLVSIITFSFFASTGRVVQNITNQWNSTWVNLFLTLEIGLIDRHERNSTDYKMILSSPDDLFQYELGRISYDALLPLITTCTLGILVILLSFLMPMKASLGACLLALLGIFAATLWETPLYSWLSRVTNLYVSAGLAFASSLIGIWVDNLSLGKLFPFTQSAVVPVSLIQIHANGLLIEDTDKIPNNSWTLLASLILFIVLSGSSAAVFRKQVAKNA